MEELKTSVKEVIRAEVSVVRNDVFNVAKLQEEQLKINAELRKRIENLEERNIDLSNRLEIATNYIDEMEQYSRRSCLVVSNLTPVPDKTDEELFVELCRNKMGNLNVTQDHISKTHRLPRPNSFESTKPPALVVKFAKEKQRDSVFKNKRNLKGSTVVISEMLTKRRSALLKNCLERIPGSRDTRSIWTDNGRILVKIGQGNILQVHTEADIEKIIRENFPSDVVQDRQQRI